MLSEIECRKMFRALTLQGGQQGLQRAGVAMVFDKVARHTHPGKPNPAPLLITAGSENDVVEEGEFVTLAMTAMEALSASWTDVVKVVGEPRSRSNSRTSRTSGRKPAPSSISAEKNPAGSELEQYKELFRVVDQDGSLTITKNEFREMMQVIHPNSTDSDVLKYFLTADTDKSSDIDADEFASFMQESKQHFHIEIGEAVRIMKQFYDRKRNNHETTLSSFRLTPADPAPPSVRSRRASARSDVSSPPILPNPQLDLLSPTSILEKSVASDKFIDAAFGLGSSKDPNSSFVKAANSRSASNVISNPSISHNEPKPTRADLLMGTLPVGANGPNGPTNPENSLAKSTASDKPPQEAIEALRTLPKLDIPATAPTGINTEGSLPPNVQPIIPAPSMLHLHLEQEYCELQEGVRRGVIALAEEQARKKIDFYVWQAHGSPRGPIRNDSNSSIMTSQLDLRVVEGRARRSVALEEHTHRNEIEQRRKIMESFLLELSVLQSVLTAGLWGDEPQQDRPFRRKRWDLPETPQRQSHSRQLSPPTTLRRDTVGTFPISQVGSPTLPTLRSPVHSVARSSPGNEGRFGYRVMHSPYAPSPEGWEAISPPAATATLQARLSPPRRQELPPTIPLFDSGLSPRAVHAVTNAMQPYIPRRHQRW